MSKLLILLIMIFMHIVDDYYLQGWLASAKQKSWWEQNAPDELYRNDYLMALFMHGFSWTFMVMSIPSAYMMTNSLLDRINLTILFIIILFAINLIVHATTDHSKANLKEINLIQDQLIHILQIVVTWLAMVVVNG